MQTRNLHGHRNRRAREWPAAVPAAVSDPSPSQGLARSGFLAARDLGLALRQGLARGDRGLPRRTFLGLLLSGVGLFGLGGCGFQLRGTLEIPADANPLFIQAEGGSPVAAAIREQLTGSAVAIAPAATGARLVLRILSERRDSRVIAVDANGRILAHELHYVVRFDAVYPDGRERLPPQTLDLVRTFDNPDVEVLGKQLEEALIYQDFATDAADRILMRLRAGLR